MWWWLAKQKANPWAPAQDDCRTIRPDSHGYTYVNLSDRRNLVYIMPLRKHLPSTRVDACHSSVSVLWVPRPLPACEPLRPSSSHARLADDFVMEPVRRVAAAPCVARSRALQAGRLVTDHDVPKLETRSQGPWSPGRGQEAPSDLPAREAAWATGRSYTVGWARRAMVVVVTARSRGSVTSERVEW